jgi:hypothetical protein
LGLRAYRDVRWVIGDGIPYRPGIAAKVTLRQ